MKVNLSLEAIEAELNSAQSIWNPIGDLQHAEGMAKAKTDVMAIITAVQGEINSGALAAEESVIVARVTPQVEALFTKAISQLKGFALLIAEAGVTYLVPIAVKSLADAILAAVEKAAAAGPNTSALAV